MVFYCLLKQKEILLKIKLKIEVVLISRLSLSEQELKTRGVRWHDWPRSSEEERNKAEDYYCREIMPLLIDVFVAKERPKVKKQYDGMILSLGMSFEPLVLSVMVVKPKKVCFLCTEDSRKYLDPVIHYTNLLPSQYEVRSVDKDNPLQIYQAIKDVYQEWGQPSNIALDFTGGTKSMSGGSAMAGGLIGADMVYIASRDYRANLRRPFPGSEHLEFIPNPYQVFGDLEEKKALDLMAQYDYSSAKRIFDDLERQTPDPRRYIVLSLLCKAYEAWDNLDIIRARADMSVLLDRLRQYAALHKDFILSDKLSLLSFQFEALNNLEEHITGLCKNIRPGKRHDPSIMVKVFNEKDFVLALMFTLYWNARRREDQGKFDMASLLLYRLLELISQVRLAAHGLDTIKPDYSTVNESKLLKFINTKYKHLNNNHYFSLPDHISLFHGYLILSALNDKLVKDFSLERLQGQVRARNYNIFAHGFDSISESQTKEFRILVEDIMSRLLSLWGEKMPDLSLKYRFINLT